MQKVTKRFSAISHAALVLFVVIIPFVLVLLTGIVLPAQYDETFCGQLPDMYRRLEDTEGKKIVIIGNSSVAFGINSALCEELLQESGEDYTVCNFGLYGVLGTRMMLELCKDELSEGDILIFAPELSAQTLSNYFSAKEAWYALDGDMSLVWKFHGTDLEKLIGNYPGYVAKKLALYRSGQAASASGIYAHASFDDHGDMLPGTREYNIMPDGVDVNNPIVLSEELFSADFIDYVNAYYADVQAKGVEMYYSFSPMNAASISEMELENIDTLYSFIRESFDFPIMSDISSRIMEKEFFYDSNYHLNESGMVHHTVNLVNDIKNQLGNTSKTAVVLPEKPIAPDASIVGEGDNSCADCFTYTRDGNYYIIDGLTEAGMARSTLIVPYQVNGLYVKGFTASTFAGNKNIEEITLQENITSVPNNSFDGCRRLKKIILTHTEPSGLSVGYFFLEGTKAEVYVPKAHMSAFINDYFWGYYAQKINGY